MSLIEIYYLGLLPALPAGQALAARTANRREALYTRRVYVLQGLTAALVWPLSLVLFVIGLTLEVFKLGKLIEKFLDWIVKTVLKKVGKS